MSAQFQKNNPKVPAMLIKISASLTAMTILAAFLLAVIVPLQPTAVVEAQQKWQLQAARAEKLSFDGKQAFKGETMAPSMIMKAGKSQSGATIVHTAAAQQQQAEGSTYYVVNVEFTDAAARSALSIPGVTVLTAIDRFADVFVATDEAYNALIKNPKVVAAEIATTAAAPPPPPAMAVKAGANRGEPDKIVRNGIGGLTGKGVVIAVVDTGLDFRHLDFITYDAQGNPTSRIVALWDTTLAYQAGRGNKAPFSYPNKSSIGTVFTKEQLTAELRRTTPTIPATDLDGHGTACASVAAGTGKGYKGDDQILKNLTPGVAPEADIIAVRIGGAEGLTNAYLLNAASEWLDKIAGTQPLVVSCSFGGHYAAHDGTRVAERQLDVRYALNKKGRAIVVAAGNEGTYRMHSGGAFSGVANKRLVAWNAKEGARINIFLNTTDTDINFAPASADSKYKISDVSQSPITKKWQFTLTVPEGVAGMYIYNDSGKQMDFDAYIPRADMAAFTPDTVSYARLIGTPGTATNVLTVGSYDWNDNFNMGGKSVLLQSVCETSQMTIKHISCYSSPGPRRDGVIKPEIVAPGQWYAAANAKDNGQTVGWGVGVTDSTGDYREMNGTSSATPYTAGIIALIFQKKPSLTWGEVRTKITTNATKDPFVNETLPGNSWGYGKLDRTAVERILGSL